MMQQQSPNVDEVTKRPRVWPFSLALIIAAIPALGYLFAYSYQAGYAQAFGIPPDLIRLSILDVVRIWFPVVGLIVMALGAGGVFLLFLPLEALPRAARLIATTLGAGIIAAFLVTISAQWKIWVVFVVLTAVVLFVPLAFSKRGRKPKKRESNRRPMVIDYVMPWIWAVVIVVVFAIWSGVIGWSYATQRTDFMVISGQPPLVVVQAYADVLVTAPYTPASDGKPGQVVEAFTIYRVDALPSQPVLYLRIGPLKASPP
jgi:hypothetical protein